MYYRSQVSYVHLVCKYKKLWKQTSNLWTYTVSKTKLKFLVHQIVTELADTIQNKCFLCQIFSEFSKPNRGICRKLYPGCKYSAIYSPTKLLHEGRENVKPNNDFCQPVFPSFLQVCKMLQGTFCSQKDDGDSFQPMRWKERNNLIYRTRRKHKTLLNPCWLPLTPINTATITKHNQIIWSVKI